MDIGGVDPGELRPQGPGSSCDQQLVVGFPLLPVAVQVSDQYLLPVGINGQDFAFGLYVNAKFLSKGFRSPGNKSVFCVDQTGDIVGDASGGKRGVWASFKYLDLRLRLKPSYLRRGAHSGRIAADYYQFCHHFSPN